MVWVSLGKDLTERGRRRWEKPQQRALRKQQRQLHRGPEPMDLTEGQQKAINLIQGPAITISGPGAGKTFVITERVKNLIENHHIDPKNIFVTTFTEKAANELKVHQAKLWDCDQELDKVLDCSYKKCIEILKKQNLVKQVLEYSGIE